MQLLLFTLILLLLVLFFKRKKIIEVFTENKPKILIVGSFLYHLECIGFLCENFKNYDITILIENDKFDYITYYKNIYTINHITDKNKINYNDYKYIIKLTSEDPIINTKNKNIIKKYNKKIISIVHISEAKDFVDNCIILCPYFTFKNINSHYIFPLYNGITEPSYEKIYILYLGNFNKENDTDNDLVIFNNNIKHKYKLIVCGYGKGNSKDEYGFNAIEYLTNNNIEYIQSVSMPKLLEYLNKTKYILARKWPLYKDRMSGSIPVSISHDIPLIINKDTAIDYNIQDISVTFNKNYSETTTIVLNDIEYDMRIKKLQEYKKRVIKENKNKMKQLQKNML